MKFSALARRRIRTSAGVITPPLSGDYSSGYRFLPRFTPIAGRSYNATTGRMNGAPWTVGYLVVANEVLLTSQGSTEDNHTALQNAVTLAASDAVRIRLAPLPAGQSWGDMIRLPDHVHVGAGMVIEPASVKDGTFATAEGSRVTSRTGLAPLRFAHGGWGIANPNGNPETRAAISLQGSVGNVRLLGLHLAFDGAFAATLPDVVPVSGGSAPNVSANSRSGLISSILDEVPRGTPDRIIIDRCFVEGAESKPLLRGTFINGTHIAILGSWYDNIHYRGNDSQCFLSTDGAGPYWIDNNYLAQAFGESVMWGGGATASAATIPGNILVTRNWFDNPQRFRDRGYDQKNLLEFKTADGAEVSANRFTDYRATGYDGQYACIAVKAITQGNGPDFWNQTRNVMIRGNEFDNCRALLSISGDKDTATPTNPNPLQPDAGTNRVEFAHNRSFYSAYETYAAVPTFAIFTNMQRNGGTEAQRQRDLHIHHNDIVGPASGDQYRKFVFEADGGEVRVVGRKMQGNLMAYDTRAGAASQYYEGTYFVRNALAWNAKANWDAYTDKVDCDWSFNAVVGSGVAIPPAFMIPSDIEFATQAAAGLAENTLRRQAGSPLLTADVDGGAIGCDHALVDSILAGPAV